MANTRVAENDVVVMSAKSHKNHANRRLFLGVFILVCLVVVAVVVLALNHKNNKTTAPKVSSVCTSTAGGTLLQQAQIPIFGANQLQLLRITQKIEKLPNYQDDQNCLYVVITYYANAGNALQANKYMQDFNQVYNPKKPLSTKLGPDIPDVAMLRSRVLAMQKND
jgi:preprotein translocase subunit SecY